MNKENLANQIEKAFLEHCSKQPCGECSYAFKKNCKILFTLDSLDDNYIEELKKEARLKGLHLKVLEYVKELFKDKVDKGGHPYINHILAVESGVENIEVKIVALLHDVLEDTDQISDDLINMGIPGGLVSSVEKLTKEKEQSYNEYIDKLIRSEDLIALKVKKSDLENNMDISRIPSPTKKDYDRVEKKYKPTYKRICEVIERLENKDVFS